MKLWLISQDVNNNYDTYDSAVVAASDEEAAKKIHPGKHDSWVGDWASPDNVKVEYLGMAKPGTKDGTVICASFNAG